MEILARYKCTDCDGQGVTTSQIWDEFFLEESKSNRAWETEEVKDWFAKKGYWKLPPEEPTCHNCEGNGTIESWIDISTVKTLQNL